MVFLGTFGRGGACILLVSADFLAQNALKLVFLVYFQILLIFMVLGHFCHKIDM